MSAEEKLGLSEISALLDSARHMSAVTDALRKTCYDRYKEAMKVGFAKFTDTEILADPELLDCFIRQDSSQTLYVRKRAMLCAPLEGTALRSGEGFDGREDEYYGLPVLRGTFMYKQDVQAEVRAAAAWAELFLFGRPDLSIRFLTADCSYSGVPNVHWTPSTGAATVTFLRHYHESVRYEGTLDGAFAYVSEHYWYEGGPEREDSDDEYRNDW